MKLKWFFLSKMMKILIRIKRFWKPGFQWIAWRRFPLSTTISSLDTWYNLCNPFKYDLRCALFSLPGKAYPTLWRPRPRSSPQFWFRYLLTYSWAALISQYVLLDHTFLPNFCKKKINRNDSAEKHFWEMVCTGEFQSYTNKSLLFFRCFLC